MAQAPRSGSGRGNPRGGGSGGSGRSGSGRPGRPGGGSGSSYGRGAGRSGSSFGSGSGREGGSYGSARPSRDGGSYGSSRDAGSSRGAARPARDNAGSGYGRDRREGGYEGGRDRREGGFDGARSGRPAGAGRPAGKSGAGARAGQSRAGKPGRPVKQGDRPFGKDRFGANLGPVKAPHKRRPRPQVISDQHTEDGVRLQKVMASAGVASRRVCEDMIEEGRVEVNGQVVTELGVRVDPKTAVIHVDGLRVQLNENMRYYVFNKPRGVVSTMDDPEGRPCISDYVKNSQRNERLFHVGRLDTNTEGLLLLTNDGELANRLTHPSYEVPKTYLVQVRAPLPHGIGAQLRGGIELEDGFQSVDSFKLVDSTPGHVLVEVVLHSGKNRIVRRLFSAVGHPVERLVRTQMGPIRVGDQKQGTVRALSSTEIGHLLAAVGL